MQNYPLGEELNNLLSNSGPLSPLPKLYPLTLYLIETPFNTFAKRADPDQAALVRAA